MTARPLIQDRAAPAIPPGVRCIAYVRVSTERQAGEAKVSLKTQLETCQRLAAARGYTVDHVVEDPGVSGSVLERLDRLIALCEAHPLPTGQRGLVVTYDASRWGRWKKGEVEYGGMFRGRLRRLGWDYAAGDDVETENETAKLVIRTMQDVAASEYREQLRSKVVDMMPRYAAKGYWQGRAPFGYAVAPTPDGEHRKLVVGIERDVRTVQRVFARYVSGATIQAVAAELNADKVPGPFDAHRTSRHKRFCWTSSTVRSILVNEAYTGRIVYKPREVRDERGRQVTFRRGHVPAEHWIVVEDAHPAVVERSVFEAAHRRLTDRAKPRRWRRSKQPYVLSGLVRCGTCGANVVGGGGGKHGAKDPGATRMYRCKNATSVTGDRPTCAHPLLTVNQRWLEGEVIGRVGAHVAKLLQSGRLAKFLDARMGEDGGDRVKEQLGRELQDLEAQRRRIVEKVATGLLSDDDAAAVLGTVKAGLARMGREMEQLKVRPTVADRRAERDRLLRLAADFPALVRKVPAPVARDLIGAWLEGPVVLDKRSRIGTLKLRPVPSNSVTLDRLVRARRCSRGACPRSCRA